MKVKSELQVYCIDVNCLDDFSLYTKAYQMLPDIGLWEERKNTIDKFLHKKDKKLSLGAGILLMNVFMTNGIRYDDLQRTSDGKLFVPQNIFFSISHSEHYVVISVGKCENGVDIECNSICDYDIAKHFFTGEEYRMILHDKKMFARLWTLKESYTKTLGKGLKIPLNSFSVSVGNAETKKEKTKCFCNCSYVEGCSYCFKEYLYDNYFISVCGNCKISDELIILDLKAYILGEM